MSAIIRTWLGFAALGAGLIHLALVVGSPLPVAGVLALIGSAEVSWAVTSLRRGRAVAPRTALVGALLPSALWVTVVVLAPAVDELPALNVGPLAVASALTFFVAIVIAIHLGRGSDPSAVRAEPAAWLYLAGLLAGALVVGSAVTPALALTEAGAHAQPHGEHGTPSNLPVSPHDGHH